MFFKKENTTDDLNQSCGIRLSLPGPRLFANTIALDFTSAITKTLRDLEIQLEKKKSNLYNFSPN